MFNEELIRGGVGKDVEVGCFKIVVVGNCGDVGVGKYIFVCINDC